MSNNEIFIPMNHDKAFMYFIKEVACVIQIYTRQLLELFARVTNLSRIAVYSTSDLYETEIPEFHDPFLSATYNELVRDLKKQKLIMKVRFGPTSIVESKLLRISHLSSSDIYDDILSCKTDKLYNMPLATVKELICVINFIGAELKAKSAKIIRRSQTKWINFTFQRRVYQSSYKFLLRKLDDAGLFICFDTQFNEPSIQLLYFPESCNLPLVQPLPQQYFQVQPLPLVQPQPYIQQPQPYIQQPQYYQIPQYYHLSQLPQLPQPLAQPQQQMYNLDRPPMIQFAPVSAQMTMPLVPDYGPFVNTPSVENPAPVSLEQSVWVPVFDSRNPVNPSPANLSSNDPYKKAPEESPKLRKLAIRKRLYDEMDNTYGKNEPNKKL